MLYDKGSILKPITYNILTNNKKFKTYFTAACAAATLAIGTLNGEQLT